MTPLQTSAALAASLCIAGSVQAATFELNLPGLEVQYGGFIGQTFHDDVADFERTFASIDEAYVRIESGPSDFLPPDLQLAILAFVDGEQAKLGTVVEAPMGELSFDVPIIPPFAEAELLDGVATIGLNINVLTCCDIPFVVESATLVVEGSQNELFKDCGTLIQGVECVLFDSDSAGTYILGDLGGFGVGDYVQVEGVLDPFCISFCQQGDGCILDNTIEPCCPEDLDGDGVVGPADLALLLGAWGPNPGDPADFDGNGTVNAADLAQLLGAWGNC